MGTTSYNIPQVGSPHSTEDPKVRAALATIKTLLNGNIDSDNIKDANVTVNKLSAALAASLGLNNTGNTGRGTATVATSQSTSSPTLVDLSTVGPSVTVTVPANGFVYVYAEVDISSAALGGVWLYEATDFPSGTGVMLRTGASTTVVTSPGAVSQVVKTTALGGFLQIPATAGSRTYTLKYSSSSGSSTFANRKLWVVAQGAT